MQVSLNWIRDFCNFETTETPLEVGARFSLHVAEVEHVTERCAGLDPIVAARVLEVRPHPSAERLRLVRVDLGSAGSLEVVCGAPNVREGVVVPFAPPGATLEGRVLEVATIRGVESRGMLCSAKELGVSDDASGLWELPSEIPPGTPLYQAFPGLRDVILEIDNKSITHRPDLWGHHGIAREFSAMYGARLLPLPVDERLATRSGTSAVRVTIVKDGPEGEGVGGKGGMCRRYCGLEIRGVRVAPSPPWLCQRLLAVGSRPISNIVDVTNYILHEIGQPLHAFDTTKVAGGQILVRRARPGELLPLLDGSQVELQPEDCVIADASSAVALAGIMGGASSEISDATTSVFLESANFAPARIRRSSVRLGKRTDSSLRFEKSLDPESARVGILRAARMILDLCPGAKVVGPLQDVGWEPEAPIEIQASASFLANRLGTDIPAPELRDTLRRLGFDVKGKIRGDWTVRVPSWRATKDVSIREDLVEEVGRIHGYGGIHPYAPRWTVEVPPSNEHRRLERAAKHFLALHGGLTEVYTYNMVGEAHCRRFGLDPAAHLKLRNAISEEMDRMRREIVPMHLEKAKENQRYFKTFGFFEVGRVYRKSPEALRSPELPDERSRIAGILCEPEKKPEHFWAVRDLVLGLLEHLRVGRPQVVPAHEGLPPELWAHPNVRGVVLVGGRPVGAVYRVHPATEALLELAGDVIAFDLDLEDLVASPRREVEYSPPLRFPTVPFDVAVVAPARTVVRDIEDLIRRSAGERLLSVEVFDVFTGEQSGEGKKSVAFHLVFAAPDRTLDGAEVTALQDRVVAALREAGYPLRA